MKTTILPALALSLIAFQAEAATVQLRNDVYANTQTVENADLEDKTFDTSVDGPLQYFTTDVNTSANGVRSRSFSGVDTAAGIGRAIAQVEKDANTGVTSSGATARNVFRQNYIVQGTGKAQVDFTVYGDFTTLTDATDAMSVGAYGHIFINAPGGPLFDYLNTQNPADALFGMTQGPFNRTFSFLFDVVDGDSFSILTQIQATALFAPFQSAFFDVKVDVKSGLRVRGKDGVTIVPDDSSTIAPVPLPASIVFFMTPLAGFLALRRRKTVRT